MQPSIIHGHHDVDARDEAKSDMRVFERPVTPDNKPESHLEPDGQVQMLARDLAVTTPPNSNPDLASAPKIEIPSQQAPPVLSPTASAQSPQTRGPIEAMDALEDEIEEVSKILPTLEDSVVSPKKPARADRSSRVVAASLRQNQASQAAKPKPASSAARTTMSNTTFNREPSNSNIATSRLAVTTQSSPLDRFAKARSTSKPPATNPAGGTSTFMRSTSKARPSSMMVPRNGEACTKDTASDYLASKRRPMSMHFPPPAPPPRSTKAPTRSTFMLPGEAIAARNKAAREERQRKEEEELQKRREFKARPMPGNTRTLSSTIVKQNNASRARMSIMGDEKDSGSNANRDVNIKRNSMVSGPTNASVKRLSVLGKPPTERNNSTLAAKRASLSASTTLSRSSSVSASKRQSGVPSSAATTTRYAPSMASSVSSLSVKSRAPSTYSQSTSQQNNEVTVQDITTQRNKGKALFNRDKLEKEAREQARRGKEDKTRNAREEAADRSRQLSREYREKQRRKLEMVYRPQKEEESAEAGASD